MYCKYVYNWVEQNYLKQEKIFVSPCKYNVYMKYNYTDTTTYVIYGYHFINILFNILNILIS